MSTKGWFGFDLDKTIAVDEGGTRGGVIGDPIKPLIRRMKYYLRTGRKVCIVSARVHPSEIDCEPQRILIRNFLIQHIGEFYARQVDIRSDKDRHMIALFDDRAMQVIPNKGVVVKEELRRAVEALQTIASGDRAPWLVAQQALSRLDSWSLDLTK